MHKTPAESINHKCCGKCNHTPEDSLVHPAGKVWCDKHNKEVRTRTETDCLDYEVKKCH